MHLIGCLWIQPKSVKAVIDIQATNGSSIRIPVIHRLRSNSILSLDSRPTSFICTPRLWRAFGAPVLLFINQTGKKVLVRAGFGSRKARLEHKEKTMFAVIKTGGKQYSVAANDLLKVEKLAGEPGDMIEISEVLMVGNSVGTPYVDGAMVTAEIVEQGRARKVIAFKKRRRQNSRRTIGHRQHFTLLQISEILTGGAKPSKKASGAAKSAKSEAKADAAPKAEKAGKAAAPKKEAAKDEAAAPSAAAPLFTAPAGGEKDKLTDIKGIGPVAERQLNEQGIMTFAQIAALTDEDVARVDEYMPFSADQINDWKAQAKAKA